MIALLLPLCDGGPADPDRPWVYRDSGDGDEDADDLDDGGCLCGYGCPPKQGCRYRDPNPNVDDGAFDDDRSFAAARGSVFVAPIFEGSAAR